MIVKISQTASNIRQSYDIESEQFYFRGDAGRVSKLEPVTLTSKHTEIRGEYTVAEPVNYIPLRWLFGRPNLTRQFHLYRDGVLYGSVGFSKHGFLKSFYVIALGSGEIFHGYELAEGSFNYVSIYHKGRQIALLETFLCVSDYKFTHKLYILDDFARYADTLSFFAVYYANFTFTKRFHMSRGSVSVKAWSFSRYKHKYDPAFRETHFPEENFFGKIHLGK